MTQVRDYYEGLWKKGQETMAQVLDSKENLAIHTRSHNYMIDLDQLKSAVADRPESVIYDAAVREYQLALLALLVGNYRFSFAGLRLSFELFLASIDFSAREIELREWLSDYRDINWNKIWPAAGSVDTILS